MTDADNRQPKLLDRVREAVRIRHHSIRTERAYVDWIRRFILFTARSIRPPWKPGMSANS